MCSRFWIESDSGKNFVLLIWIPDRTFGVIPSFQVPGYPCRKHGQGSAWERSHVNPLKTEPGKAGREDPMKDFLFQRSTLVGSSLIDYIFKWPYMCWYPHHEKRSQNSKMNFSLQRNLWFYFTEKCFPIRQGNGWLSPPDTISGIMDLPRDTTPHYKKWFLT